MLSLHTPLLRSVLAPHRVREQAGMSLRQQQARLGSTEATSQHQSAQSESQSSSSTRRPCHIEDHLSQEAKSRTLSTLSKFIFGFAGIPDMVSLHGGLPPPSIFPFKSLKMELRDGQVLDIPAGDKVSADPGASPSRCARR